MLIKNIYVYNDKGIKELKHVQILGMGSKRILNLNEDLSLQGDEKIINAQGNYFLMPGMLDAHVHGQGGVDFADLGKEKDENALHCILSALGKTGLSYALATLVSLPLPKLKESLKKLNGFIKNQAVNLIPGETQILGVHLEGPFISKKCKGAHAETVLQDRISMDLFREIIDVAPAIKHWKITLAPDLPGAEEFIKQSKKLETEGIYVKVFIGHCNPDDKELLDRAIAAGAAGITHAGNACQESCSRETKKLAAKDATSHVIQWILENPEQCPAGVEIISDGTHVSPAFVSLIRTAIKNKIVLITDALGPAGCSDGLYQLGELKIRKERSSFYLADSNGDFLLKEGVLATGEKGLEKILAGSAATLAQCAKKYIESMEGEPVTNCMDALFSALVTNPRLSSLPVDAVNHLPDHNNFVVFDNTGQMLLSSCHGKVSIHQEIQWSKSSLLHHGFLSVKDNRAKPNETAVPTHHPG